MSLDNFSTINLVKDSTSLLILKFIILAKLDLNIQARSRLLYAIAIILCAHDACLCAIVRLLILL